MAAGVSALDRSEPSPPLLLSQTRLYVEGSTSRIHPENRPFSPQYPLWSDGASKARWIYLPPGTAIDTTDVDSWRFPVGTIFWKEFVFAGRRAETRMIWQSAPGEWGFATYVWREDGSDADLCQPSGLQRSVTIEDGKYHSIPAVAECHACHLAGGSPVLGFQAWQLSTDRDPFALHAEVLRPEMLTLATLINEGWLQPGRRELLAKPPRVRASDGLARTALGYLAANCSGCHNPTGPLAHLGLDFRAAVRIESAAEPLVAQLDVLNDLVQHSEYCIPNTPPESTRWIEPGAPDLSAVVYRMSSRRPMSQMPPLGSKLVDREAVELMRHWVSNYAVLLADAREPALAPAAVLRHDAAPRQRPWRKRKPPVAR